MGFCRTLFCVVMMSPIVASGSLAQSPQSPPASPTLQINSNLVILDVTVLDKKGNPVVKGLTRDDFAITEDKRPERIFSFETPDVHILKRGEPENREGQAPVTILVLDLLNSSFEDMAYIRYEVKRWLMAQPAQLASPAEMLVTGNESLEMLQGYTRRRDDLVFALDHLPAALPYKYEQGAFFWERFQQSMDALQQIALQNRGVPGRKNVIWVGRGGPAVYLEAVDLPPDTVRDLKEYVHDTVNMLVNSRVSLFVIYPGLSANAPGFRYSAMQADVDIGDDDPFSGDINFGMMVNETGGKLFYNRNDVDAEIARSEIMGADYYTLSYQPEDVEPDGKFRRIRVTVRNPNLRVVTKAGYYAPDSHARLDTRQQSLQKLFEATVSTIPFNALGLYLSDVVRHPDTRSAEFTVMLAPKNLTWLPAADGKDESKLTLAVASLDAYRAVLGSKAVHMTLAVDPAKLDHLPDIVSKFPLTIRVPRRTKCVRVVIEDNDGGRIGAAEINRKSIDAAPEAPTPEPQLFPQRPVGAQPADPAAPKPAGAPGE
jgi:VWFA-related protein